MSGVCVAAAMKWCFATKPTSVSVDCLFAMALSFVCVTLGCASLMVYRPQRRRSFSPVLPHPPAPFSSSNKLDAPTM